MKLSEIKWKLSDATSNLAMNSWTNGISKQNFTPRGGFSFVHV